MSTWPTHLQRLYNYINDTRILFIWLKTNYSKTMIIRRFECAKHAFFFVFGCFDQQPIYISTVHLAHISIVSTIHPMFKVVQSNLVKDVHGQMRFPSDFSQICVIKIHPPRSSMSKKIKRWSPTKLICPRTWKYTMFVGEKHFRVNRGTSRTRIILC
jgi:hypothetical protein